MTVWLESGRRNLPMSAQKTWVEGYEGKMDSYYDFERMKLERKLMMEKRDKVREEDFEKEKRIMMYKEGKIKARSATRVKRAEIELQ